MPVKIDQSTGSMDPSHLAELLKTRATNSRAIVYVVPYGSNPLGIFRSNREKGQSRLLLLLLLVVDRA